MKNQINILYFFLPEHNICNPPENTVNPENNTFKRKNYTADLFIYPADLFYVIYITLTGENIGLSEE